MFRIERNQGRPGRCEGDGEVAAVEFTQSCWVYLLFAVYAGASIVMLRRDDARMNLSDKLCYDSKSKKSGFVCLH